MDLEPFLNPLEPSSEAVRGVVEPALASVGLELIQLHFVRGSHKDTLRLFVDKRGAGGISMAELEKANRLLSDVLDVEDSEKKLFPHAYDLEVSSPGLDRPLTKKSHFVRVVGQKVRVKTKVSVHGSLGPARSFTGSLSVKDDVNVVIDGSEIAFDDILSAHVVYEFETPQKPGKRKATAP